MWEKKQLGLKKNLFWNKKIANESFYVTVFMGVGGGSSIFLFYFT